MGIETNTEVDTLQDVADGEGGKAPAANKNEQQKTNERLGNRPSLEAFWHATDGTTAEPIEARSVPEGVTVLVTADEANTGACYVGNENAQPVKLETPKDVFTTQVKDTSAICVRTPNAGDRVGVTFEA